MPVFQVKRGTKAELNGITLAAGELGFTTDTKEVYIGDGASNNLIGSVKVDVVANKPAAGVAGRIFHQTDGDDAGDTFLDDGAQWVKIGVSNIGDLSGDLDDIDDGTSYQRVAASEVDESGYVTQVNDGANVATASDVRGHLDDDSIHQEHPASSAVGNIATFADTTGGLDDSGVKVSDAGSSSTDLWSAQKIQNTIDLAIAGLDIQADVLDIQVDDTLDPGGSPDTGARYIMTDSTNAHANFGSIDGLEGNDIVEYDGDSFEVAYDVSEEGEGALCWDRDSGTWQRWDGSSWDEFGGLAGITAGNGLTKDGSILHVGAGDGVDVDSDDIAVDVTDFIDTDYGLEENSNDIRINLEADGGLQFDGSNHGIEIKADTSTGDTIAPLAVGADGAGVEVDNSTIKHSNGVLEVGDIDGGSFV